MTGAGAERTAAIAAAVETFVREVAIPFEADPRRDHHGAPTDALVAELKEMARAAGVHAVGIHSPFFHPDDFYPADAHEHAPSVADWVATLLDGAKR